MHKIINGFCNDTHPSKFEEAGCAVCDQLVVMTKLIQPTNVKCSLGPLMHIGVTHLPWNSVDDPVRATAERLSRDLSGDPKHIYKHKI